MKRIKEQKAITLIALIITIIVLLILAVVAIVAVQEDGIIGKAKYARDEYEKAQAKENSILQGYLSKIEENLSGGNLNTGVAFSEIDANDYGASIEYSVDLNNDGDLTNDWKVFYKDDTYLYIIASDYLNNENLPTGLNMSTYNTYGAYWTWPDGFISENASTITSEVAEKYKLSWLADNSSSADDSARATADLLNVEVWTEKFVNAEKGIEAIGAPTLEMWVASWNEKGAELGIDKYVEIETEYNSTGYNIVWDGEINSEDTLYFPHRETIDECEGYWLASPNWGAPDRPWRVMCYGGFAYDSDYQNSACVRPLISVPSELITSDVDGSFRVVE